MPTSSYQLPDQYAGKSLDEIGQAEQQAGRGIPRLDMVAQMLGIGQNSPLQAGQAFDLSSPDMGSGEYQWLSKTFKPAPGPEMRAIQPAVNSLEASLPENAQKFQTERTRLEGEKEPLKQRYQTLLQDLKNRESQAVTTAQTASAREFGKRGVPLSSGAYDQYLGGQVNPLVQNFATLYSQTGQQQEEGLRNISNMISGLVPQEVEANRAIRNAIAQMQAGAGKDALQNAMAQLQMQEQQRQFNSQQGLAQEQFNFQKQQAQSEQKANDISKNFMSLSEGNTLFNLLTGQPMFTAPKTYKPESSDADVSGLYGLVQQFM